MTVNFYLEKRKQYRKKDSRRKKTGLTILLYIRFEGKLFKVGTGKKILPEYWDSKTQRPIETYPLYKALKKFLDTWELEARRVELEADMPLSVEYLKNNLSFLRQHDGSFFGIWDVYKQSKGNKVRPGTLKAYNTAWKTLKVIDGTHPGLNDPGYQQHESMSREREFIQEKRSYKIEFSTINEDFVDRLIEYTQFMGYNNEFCNQLLTRVKAFMNWAVKHKYLKDVSFRELETGLKKRDEDTNIYFLMADELAYLTHMKISDERLDRVRDVFCFGAYTGLRYGDIKNFRKDNVIEDQYSLTQEKTGKLISNPLFEPASRILKKYENLPGDFALPQYSNQKMNDYLKELGRLAGFDRKITLYNNIGSESKRESFQLYSLLSTHVARKTFITYLINSGIDKNVVRTWTGQSEAVIDRYYAILSDYKKKQAAILNKKFKKDAANGKKLRKV